MNRAPAVPSAPPNVHGARPGEPLAGGRFTALTQRLMAYARWLDSIGWGRFTLLGLLALIASAILAALPPFSTPWGRDRHVPADPPAASVPGRAPASGSVREPAVIVEPPPKPGEKAYRISIGSDGVRVEPLPAPAGPASSATGPAAVHLVVPPGGLSERDLQAIRDALRDAASAKDEDEDAEDRDAPRMVKVRAFRLGDALPQFTMLLIVLSAVIKVMAAGRFKAEARAVAASEKAEAEALRRQVVEARMAAMQAQIEPHFLFNTLASIDHLIETDPPRASRMQRHLIALLRASMPGLRESAAEGTGLRPLSRELDMVRPYLEILKMRMEDRLQASLDVPDGLLSALFPPLVVQSLVENAIRHGLEPKPEGGSLDVRARVVDGRLEVAVADSGLGFVRASVASTAGTGVGLANVRERLALLYADQARLEAVERPGGGTVVTVTVPYRVAPTAAGASAFSAPMPAGTPPAGPQASGRPSGP